MDTSTSRNWLHHYPELEQLSDPPWLKALEHIQCMEVPAETTIFRPGDPCDGLLFLIEGSVRVFMSAENGREIVLYRLQDSNICVLTLTTMLQSADYAVEAVTDTKARAALLPTRYFHQAFAGSPGFQNFILNKMAGRMHETLFLLQEIAFERLDMRLACLLFRRFRQQQGSVLDITHQQIAHELATTREVVSRLLKDLEHQQCIRLFRGRIELVDDHGLEQISSANKLAQHESEQQPKLTRKISQA